jgi:hypothetical protein
MDSGEMYRNRVLADVPPMKENSVWRLIDPRDRHRIDCDRVGMCGQTAVWATQQGNVHVCDYHRFLMDVQRAVECVSVQILDETAA